MMKQQKLKEIKKRKVLYLLVWRQNQRPQEDFRCPINQNKSTLAWINAHSNRSKVKLRFPHLQQNSKAATRNILATTLLVV